MRPALVLARTLRNSPTAPWALILCYDNRSGSLSLSQRPKLCRPHKKKRFLKIIKKRLRPCPEMTRLVSLVRGRAKKKKKSPITDHTYPIISAPSIPLLLSPRLFPLLHPTHTMVSTKSEAEALSMEELTTELKSRGLQTEGLKVSPKKKASSCSLCCLFWRLPLRRSLALCRFQNQRRSTCVL